MPKICIIGGGISGLAHAWQLQQTGHAITLLESSERVGGAMDSFRQDGYLAECGPNSIQVNSHEVDQFLASIPGLDQQIIEANTAAKKRFIVRNGKVHSVPTGPLSAVTTPLWSFAGKLRVLKEPFIKPADPESGQSVADFVRRRLGDELYQYAINPLVGGIYAGRPEKLSLRYAFPKLHRLEQEHGGLIRGAIAKMKAAKASNAPKVNKRIVSCKEGLGEIPQYLQRALGDAVQMDARITSIKQAGESWAVQWERDGQTQTETFDHLILTLPAHQIKKLPLSEAVAEQLKITKRVTYPPVSVISLGFPRDAVEHPLDGFGALVPQCEQRAILGVLFPSSLFVERAPEGHVLMTVFVGGDRQPEIATADTEQLLATVLPELEALLGVSAKPSFVHHRHWPLAIPQYDLQYGEVLAALDAVEREFPGLHITGNYRHGISLTNCIETAVRFSV